MAWLTVWEAFERMKREGISKSIHTIIQWIKEGKLKAEKSSHKQDEWRIDSNHLEQWIQEHKPSDMDIVTELTKAIKTIREAYEEVKKERDRLQTENELLQETNKQLRADNEQLKEKLERLTIELNQRAQEPKHEPPTDPNQKLDHKSISLPAIVESAEGLPVEILQETEPEEKMESVQEESASEGLTKEQVEEIWRRVTKDTMEDEDVVTNSKNLLFSTLFKNDHPRTVIERTEEGYYICPFRSGHGKYFDRVDRLIETAIPYLIRHAKIQKIRDAERKKYGY
ncbi:helix-turn-helix domain-containing protein [Thermoflavimicrobium dichotomicum]|uniref:Uncharacterized protein n=1 Tax=Thermoflavimicrobium dichotomicum TaxID=46223 RepID=A0A1I3P7L4_9BACL|nr:helix-turn-helix domain-containing protein [Thermoflavimicrobium dichotomicum]SFJ17503.1 hypothetical protein SAMN05421852_105124 [Thermoflavimicrobium dichotomicum]